VELTPSRARKLVELAFVIEPILNKKDCTTRYKDLEGKSLYDFIISGINVGPVFEDYAKQALNSKNILMFSHLPRAAEVSNNFKREKSINVGLLEFMFVTLKMRFEISSPENLREAFLNSIKNTNNQDVLDNLKGFRVGIKTSKNQSKKEAAKKNYEYFKDSNNIYELYTKVLEKFPNSESAGYQVANEYLKGFPTIEIYMKHLNEDVGLIRSLERTYDILHKNNPEIKVGILADLCASSIFLHLSFQNPNTYVIR